MPHKHVNRCCWFCAQILLPEDWSLMLTATLFCIELPPGPLSHHFPKPLTSGQWPIPCLYSTVAAPDLPMDQAKAIARGDHILVQISYSALFCFSYSFIKKSHSQETLPHTASEEPPEDNLVPSNLQCYLSSPESKSWRQLFTENGQRCPETCTEAVWSSSGLCPSPTQPPGLGLWLAHRTSGHTAHGWAGRVAGPLVLHIDSYLLALFKLWMRLFTFLKSAA